MHQSGSPRLGFFTRLLDVASPAERYRLATEQIVPLSMATSSSASGRPSASEMAPAAPVMTSVSRNEHPRNSSIASDMAEHLSTSPARSRRKFRIASSCAGSPPGASRHSRPTGSSCTWSTPPCSRDTDAPVASASSANSGWRASSPRWSLGARCAPRARASTARANHRAATAAVTEAGFVSSLPAARRTHATRVRALRSARRRAPRADDPADHGERFIHRSSVPSSRRRSAK